MKETVVYQRTDLGRDEIRNKSHGLTQSERLTLLMIDGVASYAELCRKLTGLTPQRLERALLKLAQHGLAAEVLLPPPVPLIDSFEDDVIDLFLQQDTLDPITVISFDAERDYDAAEDVPLSTNPAPPESVDLESWVAAGKSNTLPNVVTASEEFSAPVFRTQEVRAMTPPSAAKPIQQRVQNPRPARAGWEAWFIGVGLLFIVAAVVQRYLR